MIRLWKGSINETVDKKREPNTRVASGSVRSIPAALSCDKAAGMHQVIELSVMHQVIDFKENMTRNV